MAYGQKKGACIITNTYFGVPYHNYTQNPIPIIQAPILKVFAWKEFRGVRGLECLVVQHARPSLSVWGSAFPLLRRCRAEIILLSSGPFS